MRECVMLEVCVMRGYARVWCERVWCERVCYARGVCYKRVC